MPQWAVTFNTNVDVNNPEIIRLVERAHALASVINAIPIPPHTQRSIDALNIMRAVRGTTGIEGAALSEEEVKKIMVAPASKTVLGKSRQREEQEARNAQKLMQHIAAKLSENSDLPLTEEIICELHRIITQGIDYVNNTPGEYRWHPVRAGTYIPPTKGEDVRTLMKEFMDWFNNGPPKTWDPIIRAIVAHFYVVSIHPFGDGNGRVSRGVESYLLFQAGVNSRGFYSLANYYYRKRAEYVEYLDYVRFETHGDLTPFVRFALVGLAEELESVHEQVLYEVWQISFRDFAREVLTDSGKLGTKPGERMFHFLLDLADEADISLKELRSGKHKLSRYYSKVGLKTFTRDLNFLKENNLVFIKGDKLKANFGVMLQFMPPHELFNE